MTPQPKTEGEPNLLDVIHDLQSRLAQSQKEAGELREGRLRLATFISRPTRLSWQEMGEARAEARSIVEEALAALTQEKKP